MKIAPLYKILAKYPGKYTPRIIHTGQHYDDKMSKLFFIDLGMPHPHAYLHVGSGTHGSQTAKIIERYEELILTGDKPDMVIVAGDVNSTIACALVAKKLQVPVAHLEAGLRSYDETMPEEINRVLTDRISDLLLTPSPDGDENLIKEGITASKIHLVGNIMVDSLVGHISKAKISSIKQEMGLHSDENYVLITLHRPSNVDDPNILKMLLLAFAEISQRVKLIFPMHPRTRKNLTQMGLEMMLNDFPNLTITDPIGYLDFMKLQMDAQLVLTDSGGIQEETTFLGIACLTLRNNTERPITISEGTNQLVSLDHDSIVDSVYRILDGYRKQGKVPMYWDGHAAERVVEVLDKWFVEHR